MRRNARQQQHEKRDLAGAELRVQSGGHLDLGMVVSVYRPGGSAMPASADEAATGFLFNDAGPSVTEH